MEIKGKVIACLEPKSGESKKEPGKTWRSQEFVIETVEQYPKHMVFLVWGEDRIQKFNIALGQMINVKFDIDAREYEGRWYNSIKAYDVIQESKENSTVANPAPENIEPEPEIPF